VLTESTLPLDTPKLPVELIIGALLRVGAWTAIDGDAL
jgi:hypothetical protein